MGCLHGGDHVVHDPALERVRGRGPGAIESLHDVPVAADQRGRRSNNSTGAAVRREVVDLVR